MARLRMFLLWQPPEAIRNSCLSSSPSLCRSYRPPSWWLRPSALCLRKRQSSPHQQSFTGLPGCGSSPRLCTYLSVTTHQDMCSASCEPNCLPAFAPIQQDDMSEAMQFHPSLVPRPEKGREEGAISETSDPRSACPF